MNSKHFRRAAALLLISALPVQAGWEGEVGLYSQYVFRGLTESPENDAPSLQASLSYQGEAGWYAGWWGANLGYGEDGDSHAFEHDLYAGYTGAWGGLSYDAGVTYYHYTGLDDADVPEGSLQLALGDFSVGAAVLLDDATWGNVGDTYLTLGYARELPAEFAFSATAGYYRYGDPGEFLTSEGEDGFRHLDITLARALSEAASLSLTYVVGSEDRAGVDQDDAVVLGFAYAFGD